MADLMSEEFERSFKSLYRPLCMYSLRVVNDLNDAEDIVQQAFTDAWSKMNEGLAIDNLKAYMYRAVYNRSLSFVSQSVQLQMMDLLPDVEEETEEERVYEAERDARLWDAIDNLPPGRRNILLMAKRDGLKYQEIADKLQLSVKTIENQMGKALKALRETASRIYTFFFCTA